MKRKTDPNPTTWPRRPHRWLWDSAEWEHSSTWEKLILIELTLKHWICCLGLASQLNSNIQCGMGVQHSPVGVWWFGCVVGGRATYLVLRTRHNLSRDTAKYIHDYWMFWYGVCGVVVLLLFIFRILSREYPKKPHSSISYTFRFLCVRIENLSFWEHTRRQHSLPVVFHDPCFLQPPPSYHLNTLIWMWSCRTLYCHTWQPHECGCNAKYNFN